MNNDSLIKTLQDIIESQNKTIEALREELKRTNENMDYLINKLYVSIAFLLDHLCLLLDH